MKNKDQVEPQTLTAKKPAKAHLTDAAFRRRLKNIARWRKKHLAKLRAYALLMMTNPRTNAVHNS